MRKIFVIATLTLCLNACTQSFMVHNRFSPDNPVNARFITDQGVYEKSMVLKHMESTNHQWRDALDGFFITNPNSSKNHYALLIEIPSDEKRDIAYTQAQELISHLVNKGGITEPHIKVATYTNGDATNYEITLYNNQSKENIQ